MDKSKSKLYRVLYILGAIAIFYTIIMAKVAVIYFNALPIVMLLIMIIALISTLLAMNNANRRYTVAGLLILLLILALILSIYALNITTIISIIYGFIALLVTRYLTKDGYFASLMGTFSYGLIPVVFMVVSAIIYYKLRKNKEKAIYIIELMLVGQLIISISILGVLIYLSYT